MIEPEDENLSASILAQIQEHDSRTPCPRCKRGALAMRMPDLEDLDACIVIRDGFNKFRRNFSPEMEDRFQRLNHVIAYMHAMIAGTKE